MKVITVAGKVDTRVLVYPLARALSLTGLTAIVTDDGAYHRLYKGKELKGNVSGVDISIGLNMDDKLANSLSNSGVPYDNLIVVSSNYIPPETTGLILCHGVDDSMSRKLEDEAPTEEKEETPVRKRGFGKKSEDAEENTESAVEVKEDTKKSDIVEEIDVDDTFEYDEQLPKVEMYISYNKPVDRYQKGILLKEGYMSYIYSCEERKQLDRFADKNINKTIATLVAPAVGVDAKDLAELLGRAEFNNSKKVK